MVKIFNTTPLPSRIFKDGGYEYFFDPPSFHEIINDGGGGSFLQVFTNQT